jgi:glycosyltransferase involved in cell wall biosynthesis
MKNGSPRLSIQVLASRGEQLGPFLAHHLDLADEVVVVDTGTGQAGEVAAEAGARVVRHRWDDDFSAARNAGLDAVATGDWVLILDTNELIAPEQFGAVRAALEAAPAVWLMTAVNYFDDPRHPEWRPVSRQFPAQEQGHTGYFLSARGGLFPGRPDLRFVGCVHETILPGAEACGLPVVSLDVTVHHYGYVQGTERNVARNRRDAGLVRRKFAAAPDDASACLELASVLLGEGDIPAARALLERLVDQRPVTSAVTRGRFLLGRLLREGGELDAAAALLHRAVADDPRLLHCWLERIRVEAARGAWPACAVLLEAARGRFGADPLLDREEMRMLIKTGRLAEAAAVVDRLRRNEPGWAELEGLADRLRRFTGTGPREF